MLLNQIQTPNDSSISCLSYYSSDIYNDEYSISDLQTSSIGTSYSSWEKLLISFDQIGIASDYASSSELQSDAISYESGLDFSNVSSLTGYLSDVSYNRKHNCKRECFTVFEPSNELASMVASAIVMHKTNPTVWFSGVSSVSNTLDDLQSAKDLLESAFRKSLETCGFNAKHAGMDNVVVARLGKFLPPFVNHMISLMPGLNPYHAPRILDALYQEVNSFVRTKDVSGLWGALSVRPGQLILSVRCAINKKPNFVTPPRKIQVFISPANS